MPLGRELKPRGAHVDQGRELVYVPVAVVVERDVSRKVERRAELLLGERLWRVGEVVVAVDQDASVLVGQRARQRADGDVREAQVDRALHVELVVLLTAARIQHYRARLAAHADEFLLGD